MTRTLRLLAVLLALGFGLAACGDDGDDGGDDVAATESETPAEADEGSDDAGSDYGGGGTETEDEGGGGAGGTAVAIADISFAPDALEVAVGDTVTWTNEDPVPHTVTADDGAFDSGNLDQGGSFDQTFDEAGEFTYHCEVHPSMQATVTVS